MFLDLGWPIQVGEGDDLQTERGAMELAIVLGAWWLMVVLYLWGVLKRYER